MEREILKKAAAFFANDARSTYDLIFLAGKKRDILYLGSNNGIRQEIGNAPIRQ
jgi:hypothetical protein